MRKYKDYLQDKADEKLKEKELFPFTRWIDHEDDDINELRQLIEDMIKWMSIGTFKQKTPHYMVAEFKDTMSRANKVKAANGGARMTHLGMYGEDDI